MCRCRFADAQIEKRGDNGGVQNISRVDESFRGRVRELGKAGGGLLRSDKGARRVDGEGLVEIGELERERVVGRIGGHRSGLADSTRASQRGSRGAILTIVDDHTGDAQRCLDLRECIDNSAGIGDVALDVDLVGRVVGLGRFPRCQSDLVAFRSKGLG